MIEVKIYDRVTPFNNVPVKVINEAWDKQWGPYVQVALVYKDGEFTGIAEPLGARTLAKAKADYENFFAQKELDEQENVRQMNVQDAINAKLDYLVMMGD